MPHTTMPDKSQKVWKTTEQGKSMMITFSCMINNSSFFSTQLIFASLIFFFNNSYEWKVMQITIE